MIELTELLERVKAATGPDRGIDGAIFHAIEGKCPHKNLMQTSADGDGYQDVCTDCGEEDPGDFAPRYTASLDAALELVERVLPGWSTKTCTTADGVYAYVYPQGVLTPDFASGPMAHRYPALALLAALLSALIAQRAP